jgi:hypothetical protein
MEHEQKGKEGRETSLVKLYRDLTGASESAGRSVFMYLADGKEENNDVEAKQGSGNFQAGVSGGES